MIRHGDRFNHDKKHHEDPHRRSPTAGVNSQHSPNSPPSFTSTADAARLSFLVDSAHHMAAMNNHRFPPTSHEDTVTGGVNGSSPFNVTNKSALEAHKFPYPGGLEAFKDRSEQLLKEQQQRAASGIVSAATPTTEHMRTAADYNHQELLDHANQVLFINCKKFIVFQFC